MSDERTNNEQIKRERNQRTGNLCIVRIPLKLFNHVDRITIFFRQERPLHTLHIELGPSFSDFGFLCSKYSFAKQLKRTKYNSEKTFCAGYRSKFIFICMYFYSTHKTLGVRIEIKIFDMHRYYFLIFPLIGTFDCMVSRVQIAF